jgi:hypothetical protein
MNMKTVPVYSSVSILERYHERSVDKGIDNGNIVE